MITARINPVAWTQLIMFGLTIVRMSTGETTGFLLSQDKFWCQAHDKECGGFTAGRYARDELEQSTRLFPLPDNQMGQL